MLPATACISSTAAFGAGDSLGPGRPDQPASSPTGGSRPSTAEPSATDARIVDGCVDDMSTTQTCWSHTSFSRGLEITAPRGCKFSSPARFIGAAVARPGRGSSRVGEVPECRQVRREWGVRGRRLVHMVQPRGGDGLVVCCGVQEALGYCGLVCGRGSDPA